MCKKQSWDKDWVAGVGIVIEEILLDPKAYLGFKLHITEIFMEELAKVSYLLIGVRKKFLIVYINGVFISQISQGKIPKNIVTEFIRPFVTNLAISGDKRLSNHIVKNVFRYLIFQSDVGMDYTEKFAAWREVSITKLQ